jgi:UPF0716 protein FxsA
VNSKLLALFTLVPLAELGLLIWVGTLIGGWTTVGLVLLTGIAGAFLVRHAGRQVMGDWQRSLAQGTTPKDGITRGALLLVGGALLLTPGVLTDLLGVLMLLPGPRDVIAKGLKRHMKRRFAAAANFHSVGGEAFHSRAVGESVFIGSFDGVPVGGPGPLGPAPTGPVVIEAEVVDPE